MVKAPQHPAATEEHGEGPVKLFRRSSHANRQVRDHSATSSTAMSKPGGSSADRALSHHTGNDIAARAARMMYDHRFTWIDDQIMGDARQAEAAGELESKHRPGASTATAPPPRSSGFGTSTADRRNFSHRNRRPRPARMPSSDQCGQSCSPEMRGTPARAGNGVAQCQHGGFSVRMPAVSGDIAWTSPL